MPPLGGWSLPCGHKGMLSITMDTAGLPFGSPVPQPGLLPASHPAPVQPFHGWSRLWKPVLCGVFVFLFSKTARVWHRVRVCPLDVCGAHEQCG